MSPDSYIFHTERSAKFVNLRRVFFSLINNNLLIFQLAGFCCKNSYVHQLLPYLFRRVPQEHQRGSFLGTWEAVLPQYVCWIKHYTHLLDGSFLSVNIWSGKWLTGDTPRPRSGAVEMRRYPMSKVRSGSHIQSKEQWLCFAGAGVKRYPTS